MKRKHTLAEFPLFYEEIGDKVAVKEVRAKFNKLTTETIASYVAISSLTVVMLIIGRYA